MEIFHFLGHVLTPVHRWHEILHDPVGPTCSSAVLNFTWIGATSHPCGIAGQKCWFLASELKLYWQFAASWQSCW